MITINHKASVFNLKEPIDGSIDANKLKKASLSCIGYNVLVGTYIFTAPESVTNWDKSEKLKLESILDQYGRTFTRAPVIDKDDWYINYIGHSYQGSFYYNTLRSQDVSFWNSSLFCLINSFTWEYLWEGGFEQPSIQDIIITPIAGVLLGELIHNTTINMGKNGFKWYEIAFVTVFNPAYAINNNFIFNPKK